MGESIQQIEAHIENTREALGTNLHELERRVDAATDWTQHFRNRPWIILGAAFAGGVLVASVSTEKLGRGFARSNVASAVPARSSSQKEHLFETWEHIKSGLMGVVTARVTNYIAELIPGFREEYGNAARKDRPFRAT